MGLPAAILALSALIFAISQAAAAFSELMSARSRCGRRVAVAFDLHADIWLLPRSLMPKVKYRMHVVTMPGLRYGIPVMGPASIHVEFPPGHNIMDNAYIDRERGERRRTAANNITFKGFHTSWKRSMYQVLRT